MVTPVLSSVNDFSFRLDLDLTQSVLHIITAAEAASRDTDLPAATHNWTTSYTLCLPGTGENGLFRPGMGHF